MSKQTKPVNNTPALINTNETAVGQNNPAPEQHDVLPQDNVAAQQQNNPAPEYAVKQIHATPRALKKKIFYKKVK